MKSDLNLASRPLLNTTPLAVLLLSLAALALSSSAWNAALSLDTRAEARAVESQLQELADQEAKLLARRVELTRRLQATDLADLSRRVAAANTVLAEKAVSWTLLLERLQELTPWQVRLDSIQTSVRPDDVGLTLRLRTTKPDFYWDFIDKLEAHPCFSNVYPSNQSDGDDGELEVNLQLDHDPWCGEDNPNRVESRRTARGGRRG